MNEIHIHLGEQGWLATYFGPHALEIADLFDSCTIPLPFTAQAPMAMVLADLQARSPGILVKHWAA
jgi:hypothetical protein